MGEEARGHNLRELLGVLTSALLEEGLREEAKMLAEYVSRKRRELAELSDAHTRATYGLAEYTRVTATLLLQIAKDVIGKLRELEGRLKLLSRWRAIVAKAASVIKELYPDVEVYVFGGAAEGRLTVLSDVDVAVVMEEPPEDRAGMLARIWENLEARGVPQYYPLEIHILSRKEFERIRGAKIRLT